jgi:hypothetical protein
VGRAQLFAALSRPRDDMYRQRGPRWRETEIMTLATVPRPRGPQPRSLAVPWTLRLRDETVRPVVIRELGRLVSLQGPPGGVAWSGLATGGA